jgi:hypothetical protein
MLGGMRRAFGDAPQSERVRRILDDSAHLCRYSDALRRDGAALRAELARLRAHRDALRARFLRHGPAAGRVAARALALDGGDADP